MTPFPFPLAHGALGWWDEIFIALAVGIFLVMFFAPLVNTALRRTRDDSQTASTSPDAAPPTENTPDTFRLE
jgi:hypothetical protein